jgi:geranylgeranyl diphosphate synthase, type I
VTAPAILTRYRTVVEAELQAVVNVHASRLYDMMRYHLGWVDEKGRPSKNGAGKALRSSLCLFSCEAVGGNYHQAVPAAAALELVHNFSLIHDDIQDDDKERRHQPTVWAVWGKPQAINAGSAMRILANAALLRLRGGGISLIKQQNLSARLDEITLRLIEGQFLDIDFEDRFDINVTDYLNMISGKTGALISGAMEIGACIGTDDPAAVQRCAEMGQFLGLAFQIRDDILGIWGEQSETGKPAGNDIRRRKKSFPIVYSLDQVGSARREELKSLYTSPAIDDQTVKRVLAIFDAVDTRANAQTLVDDYNRRGLQIFDQLKVSPPLRAEMAELVQFLTGRNY